MPRARRSRAAAAEASTQPRAGSTVSNPIVQRLAATDESERKTLLERCHPLFTAYAEQYRLRLDAYEGAGGFVNGEYLWKYANEKNDEFTERQKQARYHNYVRSLVNIYVRHIFRAGVTREAAALPELEAWWKNVDGAGTSIDAFMKRGAKLALASGISGALVDKDTTPPTGPSRADDTAKVTASWFTATGILDWHERAGELVGVKLLEAQARTSILDAQPSGDESRQYLIWDRTAWARFTADGEVVDASDAATPLGLVPLAIVRPDPSAEHPFLGYALTGNGDVVKALYNRCSEEDEVLRDQAFSLLAVSVPEDGNVEDAKKQLGTDVGTTRAIVVKGTVQYVTADMAAPEQIRKNIEGLVREIYRMAHVRYERDSLDAESADAIRLQHTELNEMLANLASTLQDVERQMAKFWYAWSHPGSHEQIDREFAEQELTIVYAREFFITDLILELEKWAKAIAMDLGLTFEKYAKKRVVEQLAAEASLEELDAMRGDIDAETMTKREQVTEDTRARLSAGTVERFTGKKPPTSEGAPKPGEGQKAA